jgi:hypothetical protein
MQGYDTYADLVLQHTLLGSCQAATAFCEELVAALAPASVAAVQQLQGQPVVVGPEGGGPELRASDLEYKLQQVCPSAASSCFTADFTVCSRVALSSTSSSGRTPCCLSCTQSRPLQRTSPATFK